MACVADSHSLIWYLLKSPELSADALQIFSDTAAGEDVYVPTICLVEITYLIEKNRFPRQLLAQVLQTLNNPQSELKSFPLDENVATNLQNIPRSIVPDMPDRIIAARALALNLPLVTCDTKIQKLTNIKTVW
ncbi:MAG: type II toxin-antitoxin system VapC family toxin [Pyrinomonadaceae bacterium]